MFLVTIFTQTGLVIYYFRVFYGGSDRRTPAIEKWWMFWRSTGILFLSSQGGYQLKRCGFKKEKLKRENFSLLVKNHISTPTFMQHMLPPKGMFLWKHFKKRTRFLLLKNFCVELSTFFTHNYWNRLEITSRA